MELSKIRTLDNWLNEPTKEESICENPFHNVMKKVYNGYTGGALDPFFEEHSPQVKIARLINADLILLEGDVIYVREHDNLLPLNEANGLLAYYMHTDTKIARQAADILECNFQGYFPVTSNKVWRNGITLVHEDGSEHYIDLSTLTDVPAPLGVPEFGKHLVVEDHLDALYKYFELTNQAVGDDNFLEKAIMYPFNQRIREKSHVLVGKGGNGKSLFMLMVQRMYGNKAYTDAPQPNFKGHDGAVISYNFIGKRVVTFNDVGDPSVAFLEWLKRMITGNLEVKTPSGAWLSVPCSTNFMLESNHRPELLDLEAHHRRYVVREFAPDFKLAKEMSSDELDVIGERGNITAGDIVYYLMMNKKGVIEDWTDFDTMPTPVVPNAYPPTPPLPF